MPKLVTRATCKHCGRDTFWAQPSGAAQWRLFDPEPVPFAGYESRAVVVTRSRVTWAHQAWPEPVECYPEHMCVEYYALLRDAAKAES